MISMLTTILIFFIVIGLAISLHEFGHFTAAKIAGIKVEEFALGFGPKIFSKKYKGTNYVIKLFPIGGSVSILGEEEAVKHRNSFSEKSFGLKLFVAVGGIIMNFLLSSVVFYFLLAHQDFVYSSLPYYEDINLAFGTQSKGYAYPPVILDIQKDSGAEKAGLKELYQIIGINGVEIESSVDLRLAMKNIQDDIVAVEYIDTEGNINTVDVSLNKNGKMGISHSEDVEVLKIEYLGVQKYFSGFLHSVNIIQANLFIMGKIIQQAISEKTVEPVANAVSGPVGLLAITDIVKEFGGFWGLLELLGVLSVALIVTNVIPLPGLDGSHVLILIVEKIRGKQISDKTKGIIFGIGMVFLFVLAAVVAVKDIVQYGIWDWIKGLFS